MIVSIITNMLNDMQGWRIRRQRNVQLVGRFDARQQGVDLLLSEPAFPVGQSLEREVVAIIMVSQIKDQRESGSGKFRF